MASLPLLVLLQNPLNASASDEPTTGQPTAVVTSVSSTAWANYETPRMERDGRPDDYIQVGDIDGTIYRSAIDFAPTSQLRPWGLLSASLSMWAVESPDCTSSPVRVQQLISGASGDSFPSWDAMVADSDRASVAVQSAKGTGSCAAAGWDTWDITPIVQAWAEGEAIEGLEISAEEPTSSWRKYAHDGIHAPVITITTDGTAAPGAPSSQSSSTKEFFTVDTNLSGPADENVTTGTTTTVAGTTYMSGSAAPYVSTDPATHNATANVGANSNSLNIQAAAASASGYTCVTTTTAGSRLRAYSPLYVDVSNSEWEVHYILHYYSLARARYVSGAYTTQLQQCMLGGSRNKKKLKRLGKTESEMTITDSTNRLIGYKWGSKIDKGTINSSLNFEQSTGTGKVSASLPITNGGNATGSLGSGNCGLLGGSTGNQVNAAWNSTYPGYGTMDFKGNIGQGLWEYPTANKTSFSIKARACYQSRY